MSVSILDEIVADLHTKHGEEASHILPEHRVGSARGCCSNGIQSDACTPMHSCTHFEHPN